MIVWKKLSLYDRALIESHINRDPPETSDLNFTNIWMWDAVRDTHYAIVENFLCFRINDQGIEKMLMPIGSGDIARVLQTLQQDQSLRKKLLVIRAIKEEKIAELKKYFPSPHKCLLEETRFDYVYSHDALALLKGNKYQAKRNLVYQFDRQYGHEYHDIDEGLLPLVAHMQCQWFEAHTDKRDSHLYDEHVGIMRLLQNFFQLALQGGALIVKDKVVAYSIAEQISSSMLLIHVEKALHPYKGAYQTINQSFMQRFPPSILYINREEDLGLPQLAKSKLSYHPIMMIRKYCLSEERFF